MFQKISQNRLSLAKKSFVTRLCDFKKAVGISKTVKPKSGDLCLARVVQLGHHQRLELKTGRRARMFVGDEIIVSYGSRYATDQFESTIPQDTGPCSLVAAGGIASTLVSRHSSTKQPTKIQPVGVLVNIDGEPLNLSHFKTEVAETIQEKKPFVVTVVGSGMNSGKTTTAAQLVRLAKKQKLSVAAIKITGTGSGGDLWHYTDSGADIVMDFTHCGYATSVGLSQNDLIKMTFDLYSLARDQVDLIVFEIADGIFQTETNALLNAQEFKDLSNSLIFASSDPLAVQAGINHLENLGLKPSAISGAITASELASREIACRIDIPVLMKQDFEKNERALCAIMWSDKNNQSTGYGHVANIL